jgi:hypothetical protein
VDGSSEGLCQLVHCCWITGGPPPGFGIRDGPMQA